MPRIFALTVTFTDCPTAKGPPDKGEAESQAPPEVVVAVTVQFIVELAVPELETESAAEGLAPPDWALSDILDGETEACGRGSQPITKLIKPPEPKVREQILEPEEHGPTVTALAERSNSSLKKLSAG